MIVYGAPSFEQLLPELVTRLRRGLVDAERAACAGEISVDALRGLLIEAGQLEQAADDAAAELVEDAVRHRLREVTDQLATAFVATRAAEAGPGASRRSRASSRSVAVLSSIRAAGALLDMPGNVPSASVRVKVPEGFAFYTLYPEQYHAAADRWLADHFDVANTSRRAIVVGVRSIGTSLSAVVAAVLARAGWTVSRVTVRPTGHPYERRVTLPPRPTPGNAHGLVVDEGPGHSGSSMAAAGQALADAGVDRGRISFLPGHGRPPGHAATEAVRAWWDAAPRYVVPLEQLRWGGRSLTDVLAERTAQLCGAPVERVEDLGGGAWRRHVYADAREWPAVCAAFERTKYRCTLRGGGAVIWKFAGLAGGAAEAHACADADSGSSSGDSSNSSDSNSSGGTSNTSTSTSRGHSNAETAARLAALAAGGWTPAPLGTAFGFVATPWAPGRPLAPVDASADLLRHIARYIAAASPRRIDVPEQAAALDRLADMLYWNARESLGKGAADGTKRLTDAARRLVPGVPIPAYGDGRLAPHEWLRTGRGTIVKTDAAGHDADHTVIGRQPIVWDVAGAIVEWKLNEGSARPLLDALRSHCTVEMPEQSLTFHVAAYAAFRVGMCSMGATQSGHDSDEAARLRSAESSYRQRLAALVTTSA